eukprot:3049936-Rhodomonas_salina.1
MSLRKASLARAPALRMSPARLASAAATPPSSASRGVSPTGWESDASVGDRLEGGSAVVGGSSSDGRGRSGWASVV